MPKKLLNLFRLDEWWHSKIAMFMGFGYFFLLNSSLDFITSFITLLIILLWLITTAAMGYFINDTFDITSDRISGKRNFSEKFTPWMRTIIILSLFILSTILFTFWRDSSFNVDEIILPIIHFSLFLAYSIPSLRLKERVGFDWLTDALYAQVVPLLIIFLLINKNATFIITPDSRNNSELNLILVLVLWALFSGVNNIIKHQLLDFEFDLKSRTNNTLQAFGKKKSIIFLSISQYIEWFFFSTFILINITNLFGATTVLLFVFLWLLSPLSENIINQTKNYRVRHDNNIIPYLYESILPISSLFCLINKNYLFIIPTVAHLIFFKNEAFHQILFLTKSHTLSSLNWVFWKVFIPLWIIFKIVVNYGIYYFRRYILFMDKEEAKGKKNEQSSN